MERKPQDFANHGRLDPAFHFFLAPIALLAFLLSVWRLIRNPGFDSGWAVILAAAFVVALVKMRTYPLKVQDRVIRLEERMRLSLLLPESERARIAELTESQLVALRFAPDAEAPALFEKTLAGNLTNKQIKQAIANWRPDYFRV